MSDETKAPEAVEEIKIVKATILKKSVPAGTQVSHFGYTCTALKDGILICEIPIVDAKREIAAGRFMEAAKEDVSAFKR